MEKSSEDKMSAIRVEMRDSITKLAGPRNWFDTRESWLARAARIAGINYRTAKSLFYEEVDDPRFSVVEKIRTAIIEIERNQEAKARAEREHLLAELSRRDASIAQGDPDFHCARVQSLREGLPLDFGRDRALDEVGGKE